MTRVEEPAGWYVIRTVFKEKVPWTVDNHRRITYLLRCIPMYWCTLTLSLLSNSWIFSVVRIIRCTSEYALNESIWYTEDKGVSVQWTGNVHKNDRKSIYEVCSDVLIGSSDDRYIICLRKDIPMYWSTDIAVNALNRIPECYLRFM
jgi:hypothetical protein